MSSTHKLEYLVTGAPFGKHCVGSLDGCGLVLGIELIVGLLDGCGLVLGIELMVGLLDGNSLGMLLGTELILGLLDGSLLGSALGIELMLGLLDGSLLGIVLGSLEGSLLGSFDGSLLGILLGTLEGSALGIRLTVGIDEMLGISEGQSAPHTSPGSHELCPSPAHRAPSHASVALHDPLPMISDELQARAALHELSPTIPARRQAFAPLHELIPTGPVTPGHAPGPLQESQRIYSADAKLQARTPWHDSLPMLPVIFWQASDSVAPTAKSPLHELMSIMTSWPSPLQSLSPLQDPGQMVAFPSQPVHASVPLQQALSGSINSASSHCKLTSISFPVKQGQQRGAGKSSRKAS